MNRSSWMQVLAVLLLVAALTGVSVAAAQGEEPVTVDPLQLREPVEIAVPVQGAPAAANVSPESFVPPPWWNMLCNGGFETGATNPDCWTKNTFSPGAKFKWDGNVAYEGSKSAKITLDTPNDSRWVQTVSVHSNTNYVLSGWIKTSNVQGLGGANLSLNPVICTEPLMGTHDWTFVKVVFNSGSWTEITIAARIGMDSGLTTGTAWFDKVQLARVPRLLISSNQSGIVSGVKFAPADILFHDPVRNTWAMYFDGSDVGITRNVDCFETTENGFILSLQYAQSVSGLGMVRPQDLIRFTGQTYGPNTKGNFSWELVGRSVGLDTSGENIDACGGAMAGTISVSGTMNAPGIVNGRDEKLYGWNYDHWFELGPWPPNFGAEDLWGWSYHEEFPEDPAPLYKSTQDTYYPGDGNSYTNKQIFSDQEPWPQLFWSGPDHGFNYVIDSFSIN